jgi:hypothetical protein
MDWDNTTKRFGLACFLSPKPSDPEGEGDSAEFFEKAEDAITRAQTLLHAGPFK